MSLSRVFLSPGLFGFQRIGSYDYFSHVEAGVRKRFRDAGREVDVHVVDVHPTASIRRRAAKLAAEIDMWDVGQGPIHLVGHSTGGLDARLIASPSVNLAAWSKREAWIDRVRSISSMSTPHYGTPLASFFATMSGQRLLYALSALTVAALKLGAPPLAISSSLVAAVGGIDHALGIQLRLIDNLSDRIVRVLDNASSNELRDYLRLLHDDQGAIIQLSPESMDLFQAGVEDNPNVYYQCAVSYAPKPGVLHWAKAALSPWANVSAPIFATLNRLTSLENEDYPCAPSDGTADRLLNTALGHTPAPAANDGVVPIRSQIWGRIVWAGLADHLDVVGHFTGGPSDKTHVDWLSSGAGFNHKRFDTMLDAIVGGMLRSE